nr:MAG TPA: hypothetical protein [Caudoviricetes sp.]
MLRRPNITSNTKIQRVGMTRCALFIPNLKNTDSYGKH